MSEKIRLRMAPSPTGFLHLGTLHTALFGYLLAKQWKGVFILRIEDTDQKRAVEGATESLISTFKQLGIEFDEGPYIQTERLEIYKKHVEELIEKGEAYYCFATPEELETLRQEQAARHEPPRYDRRFRDYPIEEARERIAKGESYVVRHKLPLDGEIVVHDELRGDITFKASEIDDYVLLKSDGLPTYQLASVVDDHLMEISHVTRGEEWIPSLPKNISLYKSFGWTPPKFIHLPLILNKTGGKLSKRQGDVYVESYLAQGYLRDALINFCALLGWHPKDEREFYTLKELEESFNFEGLGISPAVFDDEKLKSINSHYIKQLSVDELLALAKPFFKLENTPKHKQSDSFLKAILEIEQSRLKVLSELSESTIFFFKDELDVDPSLLIWKKLSPADVKNNLIEIQEKLENIEAGDWNREKLESAIVEYLKASDKQLGDFLWPMRVALSGQKASPGPFEIAAVLGKTETLAKITSASGKL